MPIAVEACVEKVLAGWKKSPEKAPKRFKKGDEMAPIKGPKDLSKAAWTICQKSVNAAESFCELSERAQLDLVSAILDEDGHGPVLRGVAALNRPYIKFMNPLEIVVRGGKKFILAQIVRYGIYRHPNGPDGKLPFIQRFWQRVKENWRNNVYGQKIFFDKAHEPNEGSLGELVDLIDTGDGMNALFDPTERGLKLIQSRDVNYASIDLEFNYHDNLIAVSASEQLEEVDWTEEVFTMLAEKQAQVDLLEVTMSDKNTEAPTTEDPKVEPSTTLEETTLPEEVQAKLDEMEKNLKAQLAEDRKTLAKERDSWRKERAQQREDLRRQKVEVFLTELEQPDRDGNKLVGPILETAKAVLLGNAVPAGEDGEVKLAEDPNAIDIHAYYREAIEVLLSHTPRTVPTGSNVEAEDGHPSDAAPNAEREAKRDGMIMAKERAKGYTKLTAKELLEVEEQLDRYYGVKEV